MLGGAYYFLIHPRILTALHWLSENLAFSFVIGMFFGVFAVDTAHAVRLAVRMKRLADGNVLEVRYEELKSHIRAQNGENNKQNNLLPPSRAKHPLAEDLKKWGQTVDLRREQPRE